MGPELFNKTDDWTPGPSGMRRSSGPRPTSASSPGVIARSPGPATLEGFANGYFSPPRRQDWNPSLRRLKCPLVVAATPGRIMMFEIDAGMTVKQFCFIDWNTVQDLRPPKAGVAGTSGLLRFGLTSGREYQVGFLGPLLSEEGMRQERRLAAYLRGIAPRFASAPESRAA
jgi:hypothetical protein